MGSAAEDREKAARYAEGDLLRILYEHHALIHELFDEAESATGEERKATFGRLTTMLKAHEMAEEAVVRPVTAQTAGEDVAQSRNEEENEADEVIVSLMELDVDSAEFDKLFHELKESVDEHAESEENEEFPTLEQKKSEQERAELGAKFLETFNAASTTASD